MLKKLRNQPYAPKWEQEEGGKKKPSLNPLIGNENFRHPVTVKSR
jgi:hypothetical protein